MTPEEFGRLVWGATDEEIVATIRAAGAGVALDRIFEGMRRRFLPDRAADVRARVRFVVRDGADEHAFTLRVEDGTCTVERTDPDDAIVTLTTDLVSFRSASRRSSIRSARPEPQRQVVLTSSTWHGARRATLLGTLARNRRAPVRPLFPTTTRSAPRSAAARMMPSAGSPSVT
jgi:hypothetical protein